MSCSTIRPPSRLLPVVALGLLAISVPVLAGTVYQWKDARGITHYSDSPPPNQGHTTRNLDTRGAAVVPATNKTVAANADCSNARSNLAILKGTTEVGIDENKDGKAERSLTAQERATRTALAEAAIKTYCEVELARKP